MLQDLIATLKAVGKSTELHQTNDGTRLLILPYGGRILGPLAPTTPVTTGKILVATGHGSRRKSTSFSPSIQTLILPDIGNRGASIPVTMNSRRADAE
jgi:hypothetical protein